MTTYLIKRILLMIPTLIGITFITYVIIRNAPGDPASIKGGEEGRGPQRNVLTAGDQGDYRKLLHLDKNPAVAYFYWIRDFFNPEANVSAKYKTFVFNVILERLPNTLALNIYALLIFYALGIPLGIDSAIHAGSIRERVITFVLFLLYSLPSFWVGLNLIVWLGRGGRVTGWLPEGLVQMQFLLAAVVLLFFAVFFQKKFMPKEESGGPRKWALAGTEGAAWLGLILLFAGLLAVVCLAIAGELSLSQFARMLFLREVPDVVRGLPIAGLEPELAERFTYLELLRASAPYYLMPVFCMTYGGLASESRYMRVGLINVLREDYIRTARAKGLPERAVIFRHALPNALTPIIVGMAGILPGLVGGAVIIETLFSVPGMGLLFLEAVLARDYNLIMAETFIGAVLVMLGILISDLLLPALDPRVTFEGRSG